MPDVAAEQRRGSISTVSKWLGPGRLWLLLAGLVIAGTLANDVFLTSRNLTNVMRQSIVLGIVAVGQTLVVLIRGIDISVAATIAMANTTLMGIVAGESQRLPAGIAIALAAGLVVGLTNGIATVAAKVPPFIVTLGTASIVTGITFLYTDQTSFGKPAPEMNELGFAAIGPFPVLFFAYLGIAVIALVVQNRTIFGRHLFAIGGSESIARLSGVPTRRVQLTAYAACGLLAAMAGVAMSMRMGAGEPLSGVGFDWDSVAAVVVGGTALTGGQGGVAGTVLGVAVISILNNVMNLMAISSFAQIVVKGAIVVLAVLLSAVSVRWAAASDRRTARLRIIGEAEAGGPM